MKKKLGKPLEATRAESPGAGATVGENRVKAFKINGKQFVVGLYWHAITDMRKRQAEIRSMAKKEDFSAVVTHLAATPQAGFSPVAVPRGSYSLAASLAGLVSGSWIGIFELGDDCYVLCAVSDGVVVSGADMFGEKEEITRQFFHFKSLLHCDRFFTPASLELDGEPLTLGQVLAPRRLRKSYRMRILKIQLSRRDMIIGGVLFLWVTAAGVGVIKYREFKEQQRIEAELARQRALLDEAPAVKAWENQPQAGTFLQGCRQALGDIPLALGGWVFETATCSSTGVVTTFRRQRGATMNHFSEAAKVRYGDASLSFESNYDVVRVSNSMFRMEPHRGDVLLAEHELVGDVYSFFQSREQPFTLTHNGAPAGGVQQMSLEMTSQLNPADLLAKVAWPGFRVSSVGVTLRDDNLNWKVSGVLYAQ